MFVTFSLLQRPEPKTALQRMRVRITDILNPPRTTFERVELMNSFFIDVRIGARLIADEQQQRLLRQGCRLALCAEGCELPVGFRPAVRELDIQRFQAHILTNTAVRALQMSGLPLYCRRIGICDPDCRYGSLLETVVKYAPEIIVHTRNLQLYQGYADKILEEYGAPILFAGDPAALGRASLVLDLGGLPLPEISPTPVLSAGRQEIADGNLRLWRPVPALPPAEAALPPGIDRCAFYAAMHERCRVEAVYALCAEELCCKGRSVTISELAAHIARSQSNALLVR